MRLKSLPLLGLLVAAFFGAGTRTAKPNAQTGHRAPGPVTIGHNLTAKPVNLSARSVKTVILPVLSNCGDAAATADFEKQHWWLSQQNAKDCAQSLSPVWREICKINPRYSPDQNIVNGPRDSKGEETDFLKRCLDESTNIMSMMASVPNPRRTHLGLMTDRAIEAIQVGAAEAGYLPLSHYLPWPSPSAGSADLAVISESETQSDSSDPGILTFRKSKQQYLLIFLIPELPTEGVDREVFAKAVRIMDRVTPHRSTDGSTFGFVGPNFSGSVASLKTLDDGLGDAKCIYAVSGSVTNAVSGSVTASGSVTNAVSGSVPNTVSDWANYEDGFVRQKKGCSSKLSFIQTNDKNAINAFVEVARTFGYDCNQVAILSEEGTEYGKQEFGPLGPCSQGTLWFLHFPREISKLRNAYGAETGKSTQTESSAQPDLGLQWQDSDAAQRDDLPTYGGRQTPLSQETVLSTLSLTLKAQGIKSLGILSTDPLDEAFLIHSLKKSSPDVRLFLRDPDLLYLRTPDVGSLNGTLLVSDYPLIPQNQFWSTTAGQQDRLITFPSAFQEGEYNSFVQLVEEMHLLAPEEKDAHKNEVSKQKRMEWEWPAGTGASGASKTERPLWLATIGTAGHYPIKILNSDPGNGDALKLHALNLGPPQFVPIAFWGLIALLGILHVLGLRFSGVVPSYFKRDFDLSDSTQIVTLVRTCCHTMAVVIIALAQMILGSSYLFFYRSGSEYTVLAFLVSCATIFLLWMAGRQVRQLYKLYRQQEKVGIPEENIRIISPKQIFLSSVIGILLVVGMGLFWVATTLHAGFDNAFLHFRDLNLSSGVAPNMPIVSLLMVVYFGVWAFLRRLSYWDLRYVGMCNLKLDETVSQDLGGDVKAIDTCLLGPLENRKWMVGFGLIVAASILALRPWNTLDMIEPSGVRLFVLFFLFLALLTLWLNCLRFINIWVHLRNILEHLENLPIRVAFGRLPLEKSLPILHWSSSQNSPLLRQVLDRLRALAFVDASEENLALKKQFELRIDALMNYGVVETEIVELRKVVGGSSRSTLRAFHRSRKTLVSEARGEMTKLTGILSDRLLKQYWNRGSSGAKQDKEPQPADLKFVLAEDIVALPFYGYIREVMSELHNILFYLGIAFSLVFAAFHTYAFRADQSIDWWFFGLFAVMGGGIVFVIAQMERNALLSRLSDGTPGELGTDFYVQLLKYGTVPFLTIFGSQVPSISNLLLKWVQPALEALH
jgi:hypothetical protein